MTEEITKQEAKMLIDEAEVGSLIIAVEEPVPVIGEVDEHETEVDVKQYRFSEEDNR